MRYYFFILFLISLLVLPFSLAVYEYNSYNGYSLEKGVFNSGLGDSTITGTQSVTPDKTPLVSDLDGDGTDDILIKDGTSLNIYNNKTLTLKDGVTIPYPNQTSNIYITNLNADSKKEIFFVGGQDADTYWAMVYEFNGTNINLVRNQTVIDGGNYENPEVMVSCQEYSATNTDPYCFIFINSYNRYIAAEPSTATVSYYYSNNRASTASASSRKGTSAAGISCIPRIPNIATGDIDRDGESEWVFSLFQDSGANTGAVIYAFKNQSLDQWVEITDVEDVTTGAGFNCSTNIGSDTWTVFPSDIVTSPLIFEFDGKSSTGLEVIVGHAAAKFLTGDWHFKIAAFQGVDIDSGSDYSYPINEEPAGTMVSNPIRANIYNDTGNNDVCVLGLDYESDEIDLLCASERTNYFAGLTVLGIPVWAAVRSREWKVANSDITLLNRTYTSMQTQTFSSEQDSTRSFDGMSTDEIVTPLGIYRLSEDTYESYLLAPDPFTLVRTFENPIGTGLMFLDDMENNGNADLLLMDDTIFYYIDDGSVNSAGIVGWYEINPCVDQGNIKLNETLTVAVYHNDTDGDKGSTRAIAYFNIENEQVKNYSANVSIGTKKFFDFKMNKTGGSYTIRIQARDVVNPNNPDTIDIPFSVASDGVTRGSCKTLFKTSPDPSVTVTTTTQEGTLDPDNNAMTGSVNLLADSVGIGQTALWLLVMIIFGAALFVTLAQNGHLNTTGMAGILFLEVFLFIMGGYFGFLSTGVMVIAFIISMAIVVTFLWSRMTGNVQGGGG